MSNPPNPGRKPAALLPLYISVGALSALGPLSIDLYLPGLPALVADVGGDESAGTLTVTATIVGLAIGQLLWGPISDRIGRRVPVLLGVALFIVGTVACAIAPDIVLLLVARFVQGVGGSSGIVVSRAIVRDISSPADSARIFSRLILITGLAPILAPVIGGALLLVMDWRGQFLFLAGIGGAVLLMVLVWIPDTLPAHARAAAGIRSPFRGFLKPLTDRTFIGATLAIGVGGGSFFLYLSMSSFVLQEEFDLSPQAYSLVFAVNAVVMVAVSQFNVVLIRRFALKSVVVVTGVSATIAGLALAATGLSGAGIWLTVLPLASVVAAHGIALPNLTALGLASFDEGAGTAAALLGTAQFLLGSLLASLIALAGMSTTNLGIGAASMWLAATILVALLVRPPATAPDAIR